MRANLIPFAISEDAKVVTVHEVPRGAACNCSCPGCGAPLIARQGEVQSWAFAHAAGTECSHAFESSLHIAVKTIIETEKRLDLPGCYVLTRQETDSMQPIDGSFMDGENYLIGPYLYRTAPLIKNLSPEGYGALPPRTVRFDSVVLEHAAGDMRPDIIASIGQTHLYIEVAVTHFVDQVKQAKIISRGVSTIEIDVSNLHQSEWSWESLKKLVLDGQEGKRWLLNKKAEALADQNRKESLAAHEAYLKANAADIARRAEEAKRRDEYIRYNYTVTHQIIVQFDKTSITVLWCRRHVSVKLFPFTDWKMRKNVMIIAGSYLGKLNEARMEWIFPSDEKVFYQVARDFLKLKNSRLVTTKYPDGVSRDGFMRSLISGMPPNAGR